MNPFSDAMMNVYHAHRVLLGLDENCSDYISYAEGIKVENLSVSSDINLKDAIVKGLKDLK